MSSWRKTNASVAGCKGVPFSSLQQAGCLGLGKAIDRFDGARGFKFSTYAHWWIRQAITRCIFEESRVIRLPVHINEALWRISRVKQQLAAQLDQPPTLAQIAEACEMSEGRVREVLWLGRPARCMDDPLGGPNARGDGPLTCGDLLIDDTHETAVAEEEAAATKERLEADLKFVLKTLPPRERNILQWRYGFFKHPRAPDRPLTLAEISSAYGLTIERVRQLEDMALTKLKLPWRKALLHPHLYLPSSGGPEGDAEGEDAGEGSSAAPASFWEDAPEGFPYPPEGFAPGGYYAGGSGAGAGVGEGGYPGEGERGPYSQPLPPAAEETHEGLAYGGVGASW